MRIIPERVRSVLCVRNDRFGEFLLNIPAFRAIKETFLNTKLIAVVNPCMKDLVQCVPFIDETLEWEQGKHSLAQKLEFAYLLKKKNIDMAIMLNPSKEFNIFTYFSSIPVRVGYARKCGFLLTHKIEDRKHLGDKHEVEYNLELVGLVGASTQDKALSLSIDNDILNSISLNDLGITGSDTLVALHPWASDPIKLWSLENFKELARRLAKQGIRIILIGGKEELPKASDFSSVGHNLIDLTGRTTLKQLAAILKSCKLLISGDSGPVHLACSVNTRVLALFRNDIPGKTAQRWGPWGEGHIVIEKNKLSDIIVEEVYAKAREALKI